MLLLRRFAVWSAALTVGIPLAFVASVRSPAPEARRHFPGWMTEWEGARLVRQPMGPREEFFTRGFPGHAAYFTDGRRDLILRFTQQPTYRLRPARDCLRDAGYLIFEHPGGGPRFTAGRGAELIVVEERIFDHAGATWADARDWYWDTKLARTAAPWWSVTTFEQVPRQGPDPE